MADHSPWLLVHPKIDDLNSAAAPSLNFLSLTNAPLNRFVDLPSPSHSFVGSGHGWIVLYDSSSCSLALFDPSTSLLRPLPSLLTLSHLRRSPGGDVITMRCDLCRQMADGVNPKSNPKSLALDLVARAIVVPNPNPTSSNDDVVVFLSLLHPGMVAVFAKPGDSAWIEWTQLDISCHGTLDAINHQGNLMMVKFDGTVTGWEFQKLPKNPGSSLRAR